MIETNQEELKKQLKEEKLTDILRSVKNMIDHPPPASDDLESDDEYLEEEILDLNNLIDPPLDNKSRIQPGIDHSILSEINQEKIKQGFTDLAMAKKQASNKADSFEERVDYIMKPLIKEWLDNHLTSIVEKIITQEIVKIRKS